MYLFATIRHSRIISKRGTMMDRRFLTLCLCMLAAFYFNSEVFAVLYTFNSIIFALIHYAYMSQYFGFYFVTVLQNDKFLFISKIKGPVADRSASVMPAHAPVPKDLVLFQAVQMVSNRQLVAMCRHLLVQICRAILQLGL